MPQMLQCYICGTQNSMGSRFCTVCGEKFLYRCPQCNANINPGSQYCSYCAAKLDWGLPPEQQVNIASGLINEAKESRAIQERENKPEEKSQTRGMNPWFMALIITVVLIVAVFIIDRVL